MCERPIPLGDPSEAKNFVRGNARVDGDRVLAENGEVLGRINRTGERQHLIPTEKGAEVLNHGAEGRL